MKRKIPDEIAKTKEFTELSKQTEGQLDVKRYSMDDTGNADRFIDTWGSLTRYCNPDRTFYHYDGKVWKEDGMAVTRNLLDKTIEAMAKEPVIYHEGAKPDEIKKLIEAKAKFVTRSRNNNSKEAVMREIRHRVPVLMPQFDEDIYALNVQNGWIDLNTGELKPHDPNKLFSKIAGAEYNEDPCAEWIAFLYKIFDGDIEIIKFMQTLIGYSMIGKNLEQKIIFLYGSKGNNGKSVLLKILESLFGSYKRTVAPSDLMRKKSGGNTGHTDAIAAMAGARLVTSSEPEKGYRLSEGVIKSMTGDDTISASFKGKSGFEFQPQNTIFLACNHIPQMNAGSTDNPTWKRVVIVPFDVQIPDNEIDTHLGERIIKNELSGVMRWAIEGLKNYQKNGLVIPKKVQEASKKEREEMDEINDFIQEVLHPRPNGEIATSEVHKLYVEWTKDHGKNWAMEQTELTKDLKARNLLIKRKNSGNHLVGYVSRKDNKYSSNRYQNYN